MLVKTRHLPIWFPLNPYPEFTTIEGQTDLCAEHIAYQRALDNVHDAYLIRSQSMIHGMYQPPLPHWFPPNPYPIGMTSMTDQKYAKLVPDPTSRTGVSWMLYSHAYSKAQHDLYRVLRSVPDVLMQYHDEMAER